MPLAESAQDRAKASYVATSTTQADGAPAQRILLVDTAGNPLVVATGLQVVGNAASGAADSGNPVKVGGVYNSTLPTFTTGLRADIQVGSRGSQSIQVMDVDGTVGTRVVSGSLDARADAIARLYIEAFGSRFNNASWDRERNNHEVTLLASAARTATSTGSDFTNYNQRAAYVVIDVTAGAAAPGITPAIQAKDSLSGKYVQIHANLTKITAIGTYVYFFGLGTPVAAGGVTAVSGFPPPRIFRLVVTADDTTSYTYSVGLNWIV